MKVQPVPSITMQFRLTLEAHTFLRMMADMDVRSIKGEIEFLIMEEARRRKLRTIEELHRAN